MGVGQGLPAAPAAADIMQEVQKRFLVDGIATKEPMGEVPLLPPALSEVSRN